ncbi:protein-lysine N-trimethyltransferase SMYD5 isoform X4 [Sagmatias obliquidens]|uniref:protein-lysine N-trimethyltransferase SMYD5 isoform X4 n=1 Tax=Sagmatias obliquidens TaxID=3371155 RepID=UPI000F441093|nr:SET and MYND domain-containing protein 5 isoform X4 [Lagenorhynchus obliquidens]XP_026987830.1 SET and MYND domain-containing protein 5 isoform X4 [Lagenorhynchus obliquidens]
MAASMCDVFSFCVGVAGRARVAVEVRFVSSAKGKGLFATQPIQKGETIFIERPLVAAQFLWNALYRYRGEHISPTPEGCWAQQPLRMEETCDHCLRALEKAEENAQRLTGKPGQVLPHPELCTVRKDLHQNCPHCQVTYCSTECLLAAAEQYHRVLCPGPSQDDPLHPLNKLQEAWRSVHYPPETASIMLMARMVATVKQAKDKDRWIRLFSQFCNKTANEEEEIVHKLLGDKFKGQLELLRRLFTEALYEEALSQWFTPDGFRSLFALVGTNGQGIGTSSLSQWVRACDALELKPQDREQLDAFIDQLYKDIETATGEFLNCEGSGLFVLQSCYPSLPPSALLTAKPSSQALGTLLLPNWALRGPGSAVTRHPITDRTEATTAVSPMQRPPSQKTTSFCMSPPWRILSQERKSASAT